MVFGVTKTHEVQPQKSDKDHKSGTLFSINILISPYEGPSTGVLRGVVPFFRAMINGCEFGYTGGVVPLRIACI